MFCFLFFCLSLQGRGAVYSFDPVGSYQRDAYKAGGSASAMLQPLLDNQVGLQLAATKLGIRACWCKVSLQSTCVDSDIAKLIC